MVSTPRSRLLAPVLCVLIAAPLSACLGPPDGLTPEPPSPRDGTRGLPPEGLTLGFERVASGLESPVFLTSAGDGSNRIFIVEQAGRIRILDYGKLLDAPFLDIRDRVRSGGERGLLSIAFPADYATSGRAYVSYTDAEGDSVIARYRVDPANPNRLLTESEEPLLKVAQPYPNHNGGLVAFGPDGHLYVGLGDGGAAGDPHNNAQDTDTLLGKLLRIDVSGASGYAIPPDNPFVERAQAKPEIWAWGLRNPWRFSFDRATGDLYIADVGQGDVEEVNFQPASSRGGENYGWNVWEGTERFRPGQTATPPVFPVAQYARRDGNCAVTGGYVYRGASVPELNGTYVFGDYCSGRIWGLGSANGTWQRRELADTSYRISSFGEDDAGELYLIDHAGNAYRVSVEVT